MQHYVAFDVETPNRYSDAMCAIGIAVLEHGQIVDQFYSLVNPQTNFEPQNIAVHGITPQMAADAPTFPQLWPTLCSYLSRGVLLAHNATFDLGVLARSLRRAHIVWQRQVLYACTVRMARRSFPDAPNHKLNTLCRVLNISLNHHDAGSDALACAELFRRCLAQGADPVSFCRLYDLTNCCTYRQGGGYGSHFI